MIVLKFYNNTKPFLKDKYAVSLKNGFKGIWVHRDYLKCFNKLITNLYIVFLFLD